LIQIIAIVTTLVFLVLVIDFIRRGLLKEKYAVLWLGFIVVIAILAVWKNLLDTIAMWVGVAYSPSLLFLVAFIFILLILLHYSVVISTLTDRNKTLAQELTLMASTLEDIKDKDSQTKQ
jgi:hypothetical protein